VSFYLRVDDFDFVFAIVFFTTGSLVSLFSGVAFVVLFLGVGFVGFVVLFLGVAFVAFVVLFLGVAFVAFVDVCFLSNNQSIIGY
jgi:hypothetical protein